MAKVIYPRLGQTPNFNLPHNISGEVLYEYNASIPGGIYEPFYNNVTFSWEEITFNIQTVHKKDINRFISNNFQTQPSYGLLYDIISGPSLDSIKKFYEYVIKMNACALSGVIYVWNNTYGYYESDPHLKYCERNIKDLIGVSNHFNQIMNDIECYKNNREKLIRLGKTNGLNYILYGEPGTGKSSFVKAIATELSLNIYIASARGMSGTQVNENWITNILIPKKEEKLCIVLIEDFDRYLDGLVSDNKGSYSAILNAIDGIYPAFNIIRFFSINSSISENKALISRMNRTLKFDLPNSLQILELFYIFLGRSLSNTPDEVALLKIIDSMVHNKLSMRLITHYLCRFLNSPDPVKDIKNNYKEWLEELKELENYKVSDKKMYS